MQYVESRMSFIAPNLSAIVGSAVAAKLIGKVQCTFLMLHIMSSWRICMVKLKYGKCMHLCVV